MCPPVLLNTEQVYCNTNMDLWEIDCQIHPTPYKKNPYLSLRTPKLICRMLFNRIFVNPSLKAKYMQRYSLIIYWKCGLPPTPTKNVFINIHPLWIFLSPSQKLLLLVNIWYFPSVYEVTNLLSDILLLSSSMGE